MKQMWKLKMPISYKKQNKKKKKKTQKDLQLIWYSIIVREFLVSSIQSFYWYWTLKYYNIKNLKCTSIANK